MNIVVHRGTEVETHFDIVDENGDIISTENVKLNLSSLSSDDFETALASLFEFRDKLKVEHKALLDVKTSALVDSLKGVVVELVSIKERLEELEKKAESKPPKPEPEPIAKPIATPKPRTTSKRSTAKSTKSKTTKAKTTKTKSAPATESKARANARKAGERKRKTAIE